MNRDKLFTRIVILLTSIILLYGAGIVLVVLFVAPEESVIIRFISSMGTLFAGLLGLCTGYLMAARDDKNDGNGGNDKGADKE